MEKVKLTKVQADALEANLIHRVMLVRKFLNGLAPKELYDTFSNVSIDDFIRAIYVGYEVIETPEERVKELYDQCVCRYNDPFGAQVVREVLAILNIKIEGVNA